MRTKSSLPAPLDSTVGKGMEKVTVAGVVYHDGETVNGSAVTTITFYQRRSRLTLVSNYRMVTATIEGAAMPIPNFRGAGALLSSGSGVLHTKFNAGIPG